MIQALPISGDDFSTWSPNNWSSVPWAPVALDRDRPVFFGSNYGIHRSQSLEEPPSIQ